jgi:hypothetical protein
MEHASVYVYKTTATMQWLGHVQLGVTVPMILLSAHHKLIVLTIQTLQLANVKVALNLQQGFWSFFGHKRNAA